MKKEDRLAIHVRAQKERRKEDKTKVVTKV